MGLLTYSAKEIHAALVAKNILLLQNIIEMQKKEYKPIPDSVSNELRSLDRLGLSKTKNAAILKDKIDKVNAENEEIQKYNDAIDFAKERLEFIAETRKVFGMPKPKDPFICSYTKYGIIVHTKWGEEADDEVLKKYYKQIKSLEE